MNNQNLNGCKVWILVGTRPEAIKQAPLYKACRDTFGKDKVALIGTGQHRELLTQALKPFGVEMDVNLDIMKPGQTLSESAADVLSGMSKLFAAAKPEWLIVQGDTTSAAMAALAAFHHGVKVAHNEAGLRSYDLHHPFPEEANRKIVAVVADIHLAPTEKSRQALLKEGIPEEKIRLVGNTGIDALMEILSGPMPAQATALLDQCVKLGGSPVFLTAHRRENQSSRVDEWFAALARFVQSHKNIVLVYPMHPNNIGRAAAEKHLKPLDRVILTDPLDYPSTCHLLSRSRFTVTDSGGIQEEASTLGVPVVVCRETTERQEAVEAGLARLAGTDTQRILDAMEWAYNEGTPGKARPQKWPFGDGKSSHRIAQILQKDAE
jgi:UDP-N-acetylglucosamine 2-epimerase (non-hydrolysing)